MGAFSPAKKGNAQSRIEPGSSTMRNQDRKHPFNLLALSASSSMLGCSAAQL
jgi:hypothetical protein